MIHNEIISSKDLPDEYHQVMNNLLGDMYDALHGLSENPQYADGRLFLSVLNILHAEFLAVIMYSMAGKIDPAEYLQNEASAFLKNFEMIWKRYWG